LRLHSDRPAEPTLGQLLKSAPSPLSEPVEPAPLGAAIPITGGFVAEAGLDYAVTDAVKVGVFLFGPVWPPRLGLCLQGPCRGELLVESEWRAANSEWRDLRSSARYSLRNGSVTRGQYGVFSLR
jgi:hypothetical protein